MANTLVTSVLSLGLSVAFILSIVALVAKNGKEVEDHELINMNAAHVICKPTDYPDACDKALAKVSNKTTSTKKDYIFATFQAAIDQLKKAKDQASSTRKSLRGKKDDYSKYARADLKNCEKLLTHASDEIRHLLKVTSKIQVGDLPDQIDPILVRLTAARAFQTTCIDEIKDEKLRNDMQTAVGTAQKHTYNSQKITYYIPDILMEFGVEVDSFHAAKPGHRRLLDEDQDQDQAYPSWVSAMDRKLLGDDDDDDEDDEGRGHDDHEEDKNTGFFRTPEPEHVSSINDLKPNVVVAQDGSGDYKSIKEALAAYPPKHKGRYVMYIKDGVYDEGQIIVEQHNVYMYGDGRDKTIITGALNFGISKVATSQTATFVAKGERFMAKGIGFRNTIGPQGHQAVAFRSQSPHTIMVECGFEGYQDTLYYHAHDQFYKKCTISGTTDFIFGTGRAYIQDSEIYLRKPGLSKTNVITADGRMKAEELGGVVLQNCKIMATEELKEVKGEVKSYLGRPWGDKAKAMVMQSHLGDNIEAKGWTTWETPDGKNNTENCTFREFSNKGPSGNTEKRIKWDGYMIIKTKKDAKGFSAKYFINAGSWVPHAGVSVNLKI